MASTDLSNNHVLEFEKPVRDLENQIRELKEANSAKDIDISKEIRALEKKVSVMIKDIYGNLSQWERLLLSRHPNRPHAVDYIKNLIQDFHEIYGDRSFADDPAVIAGFGYFCGMKVAVIGIEKGRKTKEKIHHNFGMPRPEGYRKALRLMKLAAQFEIPVITFVDTPGAYPGVGAEERGQAQAIAENIAEMSDLPTPVISVIIGEGGSGGALGIAVADRVLMMEYSVYSVISPESCASILWADPKMAEQAANALNIGPNKALELKVIDAVIPEPIGGAHKDEKETMEIIKKTLDGELKKLLKQNIKKILASRFEKFRQMGNESIIGNNGSAK